jgi:hypothetical protein
METLGLLLGTIPQLFRVRRDLLLENLALQQQLAAPKRKHPGPRLGILDKLLRVLARRFWSGWKDALVVVTPETVVQWHWALTQFVRLRVECRMISSVEYEGPRRLSSGI